ncbi:MAG: CAAX amino terminal protease self- immunity [Candidatus Methanolliviera sp. GoM_oil]|nr:MAG: CAAX amino terminal protease self- immunity [Candidatus Methanolliviera sp. GoM_oil]
MIWVNVLYTKYHIYTWINKYRDSLRNLLMAIIFSFIVLICDLRVVSVLNPSHFVSDYFYYALDFLFVFLSCFFGLTVASWINLPKLWVKENLIDPEKFVVYIVLLLFIAGLNFLSYYSNPGIIKDVLKDMPFLRELSKLGSSGALALSLRAGVNEEILFRLFGISLVTFLLTKIKVKREGSLVVAIVISSIFFGLIHPSFPHYFFFGLLFGFLYIQYGLVPVMIFHFLADFSQFFWW